MTNTEILVLTILVIAITTMYVISRTRENPVKRKLPVITWTKDKILISIKLEGMLPDFIENPTDEVALLTKRIDSGGFSEVIGYASYKKVDNEWMVSAAIYRPFSWSHPVALLAETEGNSIKYIYLSSIYPHYDNMIEIK